MIDYKTVFIESHYKSKSALSSDRYVVNGDQMARDMKVAIKEYASQGYQLHSTESIISSRHSISHTQGIVLIFKKEETV